MTMPERLRHRLFACSLELGNYVPDDAVLDVDIAIDDSIVIDNLAVFNQQSVLRALEAK